MLDQFRNFNKFFFANMKNDSVRKKTSIVS